ncbi:MAG: CpsB/CapC family capsule biosynthesis tyrosine phosphatase [Bacilli bacterium]
MIGANKVRLPAMQIFHPQRSNFLKLRIILEQIVYIYNSTIRVYTIIGVVIAVDMHSHILWNVDDGPKKMEETMKLFEQAVKEGITQIISTSHSNHPLFDVDYHAVTDQINLLQDELTNHCIPLTLHTGHEVRLSEKIIPLYKSNHIHTLANSQYFLLELPSNSVPTYTKHIIHALLTEGITPIIAHPERNKAIVEKLARWSILSFKGRLHK